MDPRQILHLCERSAGGRHVRSLLRKGYGNGTPDALSGARYERASARQPTCHRPFLLARFLLEPLLLSIVYTIHSLLFGAMLLSVTGPGKGGVRECSRWRPSPSRGARR